jgi:hypothetical protein
MSFSERRYESQGACDPISLLDKKREAIASLEFNFFDGMPTI